MTERERHFVVAESVLRDLYRIEVNDVDAQLEGDLRAGDIVDVERTEIDGDEAWTEIVGSITIHAAPAGWTKATFYPESGGPPVDLDDGWVDLSGAGTLRYWPTPGATPLDYPVLVAPALEVNGVGGDEPVGGVALFKVQFGQQAPTIE